ncbi:MAG: carboxylating nicotinate-nucleotide diphosphorylase [Thermomicrobiales bacterium]|nr:carboxylating nicotinate-nucleotide diphosphorylase [Thermomicrobiales bacterium]
MNDARSYALTAIIDLALSEDIGSGDVTSNSTISPSREATATMLVKADGVVFGLDVARAVFERVDSSLEFTALVEDGTRVSSRTDIARVRGNARSILLGERVALNFIQRLSGVATVTAAYVAAVEGTNAQIVDTRKTTPGMRTLEKAAVRAGGARNHRFGLSDGVLIKDNHLAGVGGADRVTRAVRLARAAAPHTLAIEVEVTTLDEVAEALAAEADIIMLDNMSIEDMTQAVGLVAGRALLEASGGITLSNVSDVARTGVDLISIGALTHSAPSLDISLDFELV